MCIRDRPQPAPHRVRLREPADASTSRRAHDRVGRAAACPKAAAGPRTGSQPEPTRPLIDPTRAPTEQSHTFRAPPPPKISASLGGHYLRLDQDLSSAGVARRDLADT